MFDDLVAGTAGARGAGAVQAWARVESAACARRLAAMVTMLDDAHAADGSAVREQWYLDNWAAVCAHIGAVQRLTSGAASGLLLVGVALRDRFPRVGALFADGLITFQVVRSIVYRGRLVTDPDALHALDAALAEEWGSWGPMSRDRTERAIDGFIGRFDPRAVLRTQTRARTRCVDVHVEDGSGLAELFATLFTADAKAFDARLDALADTVCSADPRTRDNRRSDAMGALAHGADRLACLCGTADCPAAANPPSSGVVIHLIAHHDTLPGAGGSSPNSPRHPDDAGGAPHDDASPSAEGADHAEASSDTATDTTAHAAATTDADAEAEAECAGLHGPPPPLFATPLNELTLAEALTDPDPGHVSGLRPAAMMGGQFLPGAVARHCAVGATLRPIVHPGQAPPEPRYRPSTRLADFVRCRDLTCRFPGCHEPATNCDLDHTIPWPCGPTQAANLTCLCRRHHLLKTFWGGEHGWRDRQLPDGTVVWTAPDGREHATTPGSRLLFPELSEPTAPVVATEVPPAHTAGLTMPRRKTTRAQDRARRTTYEREHNQAEAAEPTPGCA